MTDAVRTAYKVLTAEQAAAFRRDGVFGGAPINVVDGFIHLSTASQLAETLDRHFAGQAGLVLAGVDLLRCGDAVRWEPARGGQLFPHLHAALKLDAVTGWRTVERDADGAVLLP